MKPINKLISFQKQEEEGTHSKQNLNLLKRTLAVNIKTQEKLKKIRDEIVSRIHTLNEFISTHRLKVQYPPATSIMSLIKFQRSIPNTFRQQSKVIEQQEAIKNVKQEAFQFLNKLNQPKPKKRSKEISFNELPDDPKKINFVQLSQSLQKKLGIQIYREFLQFHRYKTKKRPFTNEEENFIIEKQKIYKDNWQKICQFMQNRIFQEVYYQFHNRINPCLKSGRWSHMETIMLIVLIEHYGIKKWAQISNKIIVKSQLQVRERFCNIMDPQIGKNIWTEQMQSRLLQMVKEQKYNFSWKKIAKQPIFENKTDNCIWRKFRNIMMKKSKEEIQQFMSGCGKNDLIKKIIQYKESNDLRKGKLQQKNKIKQHIILKDEQDKAQIISIPPNDQNQSSFEQKNIKINAEDNDEDVNYVIY